VGPDVLDFVGAQLGQAAAGGEGMSQFQARFKSLKIERV